MLCSFDNIILESDRIKPGLITLGIDVNYEIVTADVPDLVESTAALEMCKFLKKASLMVSIVPESRAMGNKRIVLGCYSNVKAIQEQCDKGELDILEISVEDDGFHLKQIGEDVMIAGANPRGVLYGVYAFEDFISDGTTAPLDIRRVPYFRTRFNSIGYYGDSYVNVRTDEFTEEKAEYLSRLGVNHYIYTDTTHLSSLYELVSSDVFPFQKPPDPNYCRKVKAIAAICKKYGMEYYQWLAEPTIPSILCEDISKFPAEALGVVKRPWGGDKDCLDRTLCVNSPIVQAHYRNMIKKFMREYCDVKGFLFYNLDGAHWLCTPGLCERCADVAKDSPQDLHNPWETNALLVSLLAETAHEERSDFKFIFWGAIHYHAEHLGKLLRNARGYDALSSTWHGSDRDIMIPDVKAPEDEYLMTQKTAQERNVPIYMMYECNRLECMQPGFPYPFHVSDALKKFKQWGVRNLFEFAGPDPALNGINALVMKAFQCDPDLDPVEFLSDLAVRQFGIESGHLMFSAWEEIRNAMNVWNGYRLHPLCGSQTYVGIGKIAGIPEIILPSIAENYENNLRIRINVEPWRAPDYQRFRERPFVEDMKRMGFHLAKAAQLAWEAVERADSQEFIGLCYYNGSLEGLGRPTRKEYAELNYASIAISDALCKQRINILRAVHLLNEMEVCRTNGHEKEVSSAEGQYQDLLSEDIILQESFIKMMTGFYQQRPCLVRVGMSRQEIEDFITGTQNKIGKLKEFQRLALNKETDYEPDE